MNSLLPKKSKRMLKSLGVCAISSKVSISCIPHFIIIINAGSDESTDDTSEHCGPATNQDPLTSEFIVYV